MKTTKKQLNTSYCSTPPMHEDQRNKIEEGRETAQRIAEVSSNLREGGNMQADALQRKQIGQELQEQRLYLGLTTQQLGGMAVPQIPHQMIRYIEGGISTNEELAQYIEPLSKALGLNVEEYKNRTPKQEHNQNSPSQDTLSWQERIQKKSAGQQRTR
jgi:hypothetical protein